MNQKDGTFCDASTQAGAALREPQVSRGLAVGDLFNDGNMDVVINNLDGAPGVFYSALEGQGLVAPEKIRPTTASARHP